MVAASNNAAGSGPRRYFHICCSRRFSLQAQNLLDSLLIFLTWAIEKFVLLLGPILICFASGIIAGLSWVFFTIVLPMIRLKHADSPYLTYIVLGHIGIVIFVLVQICFNYFMCVVTTNKGPNYDRVVRELARATKFNFPETPEAVDEYKRDYEDRMLVRMRQRQLRASRDIEQARREESQSSTTSATGSTSLDTSVDDNGSNSPNTVKNRKPAAARKPHPRPNLQPTPMQLRKWMLMAPDEWGFCQRSKQPKPPRAHYDHVTKTLVLCLDHYCPWMFNAIGYFNYRYFCNFLWFVELAMIYGAIICFEPFQNTTGTLYRHQMLEYKRTGDWKHIYPMVPTQAERMPVSLAFMLCASIGIAVAALGGFHLYLCLTAQTTIEFHGNYVNRRKAAKLQKKWKNPYDMGWHRNWQQVYGTQPIWKAVLIPSIREPEFLPLPIPGGEGKRSKYGTKLVSVAEAQPTSGTIQESTAAATSNGDDVV